MDSTRPTPATGTPLPSTRIPGPSRGGHRTLTLALSAALLLSACSSGADDGAVAVARSDAPGAGAQTAPGSAGTGAGKLDMGGGSAENRPVDTPIEDQDANRAQDEDNADPGDASDDSTDANDDMAPEPAPSRPGGVGGSVEDDLLPPDFSAADSVLREDAFDGPDLRLGSVTLSSEETHRVVLLMDGTAGYPGWEVHYQTSGSEPSSSTLQISLVGVKGSTPPLPTSPTLQLQPTSSAGDLTLLLHLDQGPEPFRVHLQHDPLRLVVEVTKGT